ncbi:transposase [Streptomyces sp. SPB074]|nr:transposase [Streptomyces sp. SPB074]
MENRSQRLRHHLRRPTLRSPPVTLNNPTYTARLTDPWSLLRRGWLSNVAFSTPQHLVQTVRRGLRHIQYRSHLIDGCLIETGLTIRPA